MGGGVMRTAAKVGIAGGAAAAASAKGGRFRHGAPAFATAASHLDKELNKLTADAIIPSMPGHVVQAFTLLKSSAEAQSVVASLASDRNVWDAVLKNEKVMEFYRTHQPTLVQTFPEDTGTMESPENASHGELPTASPFSDFVDNAKKTVKELVDNITHFFQDMFGNQGEARPEWARQLRRALLSRRWLPVDPSWLLP